MTSLDVRTDLERYPWTHLRGQHYRSGLVTRVGLVRNGTDDGHAVVALSIALDDGSTVVAQTTLRLAYAAARALASSAIVAEEDLS